MDAMMKAIVLRGPRNHGLERIPRPTPKSGEVLVRIKAVSICGTDPKVFDGSFRGVSWPPSYPFIPGHEFSGEVMELGDNAPGFKVGDRVAGEAHCGCGMCENCRSGEYTLCLNYGRIDLGHRHYGFTCPGAYAEYGAYNIKALTHIPDGVSYAEAALTDTAGTALHAINLTGTKIGGYSLIIGPGPIGVFIMQLAKLRGSRTIVVGRRDRLTLAEKLGSDYVVNYEECPDIVQRVKAITNGVGADAAYECAGSKAAMSQCIRAVRKNGHVAFLSIQASEEHSIPTKELVMNQIHVHGSRANPNCSKDVLRLIGNGKLDASSMITHTFPLDDFAKALEVFSTRLDGAMKVVLEP